MRNQSESDEEWLHDSFDRYSMSRDPSLRDEIAEHTLWLATRGARRFADRGEPFDDLVQVARIGLLNAIDRFDPAHGVPFGAYATPTIMGELRRYFRTTRGVFTSRAGRRTCDRQSTPQPKRCRRSC
jgi:RNA polymerase sigma factor (sigma-70 family)